MANWTTFKSYKRKNFNYFHIFSVFANILLLVMPIYSLQIYNRVLTSQSTDTLFFIVVITAALVCVQIGMDYSRQQILNNLASVYDSQFDTKIVNYSLLQAAKNSTDGQGLYKDHQLTKQYLASPFHRSLADIPWSLAFVVVLFILHPVLGYYALVSTIILAAASGTLLLLSHKNMNETKLRSAQQNSFLLQLFGGSRFHTAHLMSHQIISRWKFKNNILINQEQVSKLMLNKGRSYIKLLRMTIQVGVYAVCAWLVIEQQVTGGALLASSILLGRILAPIDQGSSAFFAWKEAREAYQKTSKTLIEIERETLMDITLNEIEILVHKVCYKGQSDKDLIKNIGFNLKPGNCLCIKGHAGSGKSLLLKLLANSINPSEGVIRINGISIDKIEPSTIAKAIAFLPQRPEIFSASIADNISGFDQDKFMSDKVIQASKASLCHHFIAKLPKSYSTQIGKSGIELSTSELQRLALARCFYDHPRLLIMDEPTTFLDGATVNHIVTELAKLKQSGTTIIFVSQDERLQGLSDYIVELKDGSISKAYENKQKIDNSNVVSRLNAQAVS